MAKVVRTIVAIDEKRGLADEHGLPWQGRIPTDISNFHEHIKTGTLLMGYGFYKELAKPYPGGTNYVATSKGQETEQLKEGFEAVSDAREFITSATGDVWDMGGAGLLASTFDLIDELYITQLEGDFHCTKFFPEYEQEFEKISQGEPITEDGITFRFTIWHRKR